MAYEPGSLDAALSAALGNDTAMIIELRHEFCRSIAAKIDLLATSGSRQDWVATLHRLRGICASFGATTLMSLCVEALDADVGDKMVIRRMRSALRFIESSAAA